MNKRKSEIVDEKLIEILNQPPSAQKEHDDVELFLLSLAPQMRRLTHRYQTAAKVQIWTILSNLELKEFRPPNPTHFSNSFEGGSSPNTQWESQGQYTQQFKSVRPWEHFEV